MPPFDCGPTTSASSYARDYRDGSRRANMINDNSPPSPPIPPERKQLPIMSRAPLPLKKNLLPFFFPPLFLPFTSNTHKYCFCSYPPHLSISFSVMMCVRAACVCRPHRAGLGPVALIFRMRNVSYRQQQQVPRKKNLIFFLRPPTNCHVTKEMLCWFRSIFVSFSFFNLPSAIFFFAPDSFAKKKIEKTRPSPLVLELWERVDEIPSLYIDADVFFFFFLSLSLSLSQVYFLHNDRLIDKEILFLFDLLSTTKKENSKPFSYTIVYRYTYNTTNWTAFLIII